MIAEAMRTCSVEGCGRRIRVRGLCAGHYERLHIHGNVQPEIPIRPNHGKSKTKVYHAWESMKKRCYNPACERYSRYGGRGITVCDEWRISFAAFYRDMGDAPDSNCQIDRINNDAGYYPGNCRWVSPVENSRNKSNMKLDATMVGEIRVSDLSFKVLAGMYGVCVDTIKKIKYGRYWKAKAVA
jgi:hypothetical protein